MRMLLGYLFVATMVRLRELTSMFRADTRYLQFIHSYPFLAHNNISDHVGDMKKLSACTNADGMVARKLTAL
jgi:hypothetical protein